jgi:hypothetical protein
MRKSSLALLLLITLFAATLTLWISAYWPVALFEIAVLAIAAITLSQRMQPAAGARTPLYAFGFIVLWGCVQLITGFTSNRFATERSTVQWMTWAALYYAGVCLLDEKSLARRMRTLMVWFGLAITVEAILQAYLTPGKVYGLFPSGYQEFVMGPIVYHTHFAVFIEVLLPIALYFALRESSRSYAMLGIAATLLAGLVVSASRGGLVIAAVEVLAVVVLLHRRQPLLPRQILLLAGSTALVVAIVGFETASHRFYSEALTLGRVQFARSTLHMIAARPLAGWGLGCWPAVYPAFATFDPGPAVNQAHTDWLQWTAEGGLPVGIAMLAVVVWSLGPVLRSIWGLGVLAVFIHAGFDYPFSRPAIGAWPILMLAMVVANESPGATQG